MIVSGAVTGSLLMIWYYEKIKSDYFISGIIFGMIAILLSWILDLFVLCALFGEEPMKWVLTVGVRYLSIPAMSIAAGYIAEKAVMNYKDNIS
ncbi:MAG: hypothetical protein PHV39_05555 [Methanomicrobium sp.]|nr:hypothetical protein [Methanomicrobium sp.]